MSITFRTKKDTGFFSNIKTDDLPNLDEHKIEDMACCQTKRLAYELFKFCAAQKGFPFIDPEIMKRAEDERLNMYQMRPFYEMAIKLMRKFSKVD